MEMIERLTGNGLGTARADAALLPTRAALGATMLYHGVDKLRTHQQAAGMFESMGIRPGGFWARATPQNATAGRKRE